MKLLSWLQCPPIAKALMECKLPMMMMNGIGEDDEWESPIAMNRVGEHELKSAMMMMMMMMVMSLRQQSGLWRRN